VVDVVGLSARGWPDLPARLQALVTAADVLIGSERHLDLIPARPGQQRQSLPAPLRPGLLALASETRRVVVLASGDPLVAGIGSTLIELLGVEQVCVHPAVSSVSLARARMGWSDETVEVVRLRGDDVDQIRRLLYPGRRVVVLSRDARTPAEVASVLTGAGFGPSAITVLGDLDTDQESRRTARAAEWSGASPDLNVVCVECVGPPTGSLVAGLPDGWFDHDGQLTKREVRASVLAHLMPRPGELLWDVGAGAGSVAIEWLRAHPTCQAVALERDVARAKRIQTNARQLGVPALDVVLGEAPGDLDRLPAPQAIFIGGGATSATVQRCWERLPVGGRMVVHAVTYETEMIMAQAWRDHGGALTRIAVEQLEPIGRYNGWKPARAIVQWSAIKESK
jgi:precorrin-6Y C5,15-methyltransferase (decarboxylating)